MANRLPTTERRRLTRARAATLLGAVLAWGSLLGGASAASAAEPGVNATIPTPAQVGDMQTLGTHWVRMFMSWRTMEPHAGPVEPATLAGWEQVFRGLPAGTKVILDVFGSPQWESGSSDEHAPPANPQHYAMFVASLAQRFRGEVAAYEIWNEEDEARGWSGGGDPGAYAALLRATYPAVKAAEPKATVVLGGLTGNDYPFLEKVYEAGAKGYFDAVGVHTDTACNVLSPYEFLRGQENRMVPDSFLAYREVRQVMLANGDDKPIWMTELSWRTTSATCPEGTWAGQKPEGVSDETQATYLRQAYHCLEHDRYVQVALWFPLQDSGDLRSGLVRANGSNKPSFAAMRDYARNGDRLSESCGVFTGPRITVRRPANRVRYSGVLPIHVKASSSIGVFRITLKIDGRLIRNFGTHSYPKTLAGNMEWFGAHHISFGRHTLTFIAYDRQRNVSKASITIIHVRRRH